MALAAEAIRRGVVVLVRIPRDKARAAVVVRSDLLAGLPYATVLPITTEIRLGISMRVNVEPHPENGLRATSQVMVHWPQTDRFTDMGHVIGRLDTTTMRSITREMAVVLGIGTNVTTRSERLSN